MSSRAQPMPMPKAFLRQNFANFKNLLVAKKKKTKLYDINAALF
jgi:hypothetical protein